MSILDRCSLDGQAAVVTGGGTIISSAAAGNAAPFNGPYAVARTGVNNLTQTLAAEMATLGIRVNGVSPGGDDDFLDVTFLGKRGHQARAIRCFSFPGPVI